MENIIKRKSDIDEFNKNEINEKSESLKKSNIIKKDNTQKEKYKEIDNQDDIINLPSINYNKNNMMFNSKVSQTSFPLLFK
jgi:hypothetical protein